MSFTSALNPTEPFPQDLRELDDCALHVLNSKLHRESDAEYRRGAAEMETVFRQEEVREEMDRRDRNEPGFKMNSTSSAVVPAI